MSNHQTALEQFRAAIDEEMKATGCARDVASSRVVKRDPELHQRVLDEANSDRPRAA